ncbi:hypothetical protein CBR_g23077 [Chara braunii]|uniref:Gamma tubulin complex component C-terminal domain-containing protein n=1 Tax=Chara braunii TaxID=69332 RepID=A0A388L3N4_CHABU|nr:hypothetical protein CBR_g23077 [Chara braunii]|eukprot:GBG76862.1 hypothetical protein CBR_g23077 [Chara braunii]
MVDMASTIFDHASVEIRNPLFHPYMAGLSAFRGTDMAALSSSPSVTPFFPQMTTATCPQEDSYARRRAGTLFGALQHSRVPPQLLRSMRALASADSTLALSIPDIMSFAVCDSFGGDGDEDDEGGGGYGAGVGELLPWEKQRHESLQREAERAVSELREVGMGVAHGRDRLSDRGGPGSHPRQEKKTKQRSRDRSDGGEDDADAIAELFCSSSLESKANSRTRVNSRSSCRHLMRRDPNPRLETADSRLRVAVENVGRLRQVEDGTPTGGARVISCWGQGEDTWTAAGEGAGTTAFGSPSPAAGSSWLPGDRDDEGVMEYLRGRCRDPYGEEDMGVGGGRWDYFPRFLSGERRLEVYSTCAGAGAGAGGGGRTGSRRTRGGGIVGWDGEVGSRDRDHKDIWVEAAKLPPIDYRNVRCDWETRMRHGRRHDAERERRERGIRGADIVESLDSMRIGGGGGGGGGEEGGGRRRWWVPFGSILAVKGQEYTVELAEDDVEEEEEEVDRASVSVGWRKRKDTWVERERGGKRECLVGMGMGRERGRGRRRRQRRRSAIGDGVFLCERGVSHFNTAYELCRSRSLKPREVVVTEKELVWQGLCALLGVASSINQLEGYVIPYSSSSCSSCSSSSSPSPSSSSLLNLGSYCLRLPSSSAASVTKAVRALIEAGKFRRTLDSFVTFHLDRPGPRRKEDRPAAQSGKTMRDGRARRDKGKEEMTSTDVPVAVKRPSSGVRKSLVNQAFAAAVESVLMWHTASLDKLLACVQERRSREELDKFYDSESEEEVVARGERAKSSGEHASGSKNKDITLTELMIHTSDLRLLLRQLADICLCDKAVNVELPADRGAAVESEINGGQKEGRGKKDAGTRSGHSHVEEENDRERGGETSTEYEKKMVRNEKPRVASRTAAAITASPSLRESPDTPRWDHFPRGEELLAYLYDRLMVLQDADASYVQLLRFLFTSACRPYFEFIRSWLYRASIMDPYEEFIVEITHVRKEKQDQVSESRRASDKSTGLEVTAKIREGVAMPSFLRHIQTPLLRAGHQLQILLALPEVRDLMSEVRELMSGYSPGYGPDSSNVDPWSGRVVSGTETWRLLSTSDVSAFSEGMGMLVDGGIAGGDTGVAGGIGTGDVLVFDPQALDRVMVDRERKVANRKKELQIMLDRLSQKRRHDEQLAEDEAATFRMEVAAREAEQVQRDLEKREEESQRKQAWREEQLRVIEERAIMAKAAKEERVMRERDEMDRERKRMNEELLKAAAIAMEFHQERMDELAKKEDALKEKFGQSKRQRGGHMSEEVDAVRSASIAEGGDLDTSLDSKLERRVEEQVAETDSSAASPSDKGDADVVIRSPAALSSAPRERAEGDCHSVHNVGVDETRETSCVDEGFATHFNGEDPQTETGKNCDDPAVDGGKKLPEAPADGEHLDSSSRLQERQGDNDSDDLSDELGWNNEGQRLIMDGDEAMFLPWAGGVSPDCSPPGLRPVSTPSSSSPASLKAGTSENRPEVGTDEIVRRSRRGGKEEVEGFVRDSFGDFRLGKSWPIWNPSESKPVARPYSGVAEALRDYEDEGRRSLRRSSGKEDQADKNGQADCAELDNEKGPDFRRGRAWPVWEDIKPSPVSTSYDLGRWAGAEMPIRSRPSTDIDDGRQMKEILGFQQPGEELGTPATEGRKRDGRWSVAGNAASKWGMPTNPFMAAGVISGDEGSEVLEGPAMTSAGENVDENESYLHSDPNGQPLEHGDGTDSDVVAMDEVNQEEDECECDIDEDETMLNEVEELSDGVAEDHHVPPVPEKEEIAEPRRQTCQGGASWVMGMKHAQHKWFPSGPSLHGRNDSVRTHRTGQVTVTKEDVPLEVVMDVCIVQEIIAQYQCVSAACVTLLQEELFLQEHCKALRRYFFMHAGDWADNWAAALQSHAWGKNGVRQVEAQSLLEAALRASSCDADTYAERLRVRIVGRRVECAVALSGDGSTSASDTDSAWSSCVSNTTLQLPVADSHRLDAYDFIQLHYSVDWPVSLVLTPAVLLRYSRIFGFLLRMKHALYALRDITRHLQALARVLDRSTDRGHRLRRQQRLRSLQLFR